MINIDEKELYKPVEWTIQNKGYTDIVYEKSTDGIAKITINRPQFIGFDVVNLILSIPSISFTRYSSSAKEQMLPS